MPLSDTIRSQITLKALGAIRASGPTPDLTAIARSIRAKLAIPGSDAGAVQGIVRSVQSSYTHAGRLEPTFQGPLLVREHARDWTLAGQSDRFGYRVVVRVTPTDGSGAWETAVTVTSPSTMTYAQIANAARLAVEQQRIDNASTQPDRLARPIQAVEAFVIMAGQQP